jgi:hypothetical protein
MTTQTFHSPDLDAMCQVAYSPADAADFISQLGPSDFKGYDPLSVGADLDWIGRKDLAGQGITKRRQVAERLGEYVENDHKSIQNTRNQLSELVDTIDLDQLKRMLQWSDSRGRVNATRLLAGDSKFRRTFRKSLAPVEAVALVVPTGANAFVSADVIFARTAVALAASELLTQAGFAVEVWGYAYSKGCYRDADAGSKNALAAVRLKAADEHTNEAIAASGGSAWFFRSGIFAMWASQGNAGSGLGSSVNLSDEQAEALCDVIGLEQAHVMKTGTGQNSVEAAIKAGIADVKDALTKWIGGGSQ